MVRCQGAVDVHQQASRQNTRYEDHRDKSVIEGQHHTRDEVVFLFRLRRTVSKDAFSKCHWQICRTYGRFLASIDLFLLIIATLQDEDRAYRKVRLRVEDVQGKNCLTNFHVTVTLYDSQ